MTIIRGDNLIDFLYNEAGVRDDVWTLVEDLEGAGVTNLDMFLSIHADSIWNVRDTMTGHKIFHEKRGASRGGPPARDCATVGTAGPRNNHKKCGTAHIIFGEVLKL